VVRLSSGSHGLLVVDKPAGRTSHDVVDDARRLFRQRGVGHAGTLDPLATGVLILLLGEATKLSSYLALDQKSYDAVVRFGRSTDTLDADGSVVEQRPVGEADLAQERVERALDAERLRRQQTPPAVSALKVAGTPAYRLARRGQVVELAPRPVEVARLELVERHSDWLRLSLTVSKGYYVRALARDLGDWLGVPAHLAALRRTASGPYTLADAVPWPPAQPVNVLSLGEAAKRSLPALHLTDRGAERARLGRQLAADDFIEEPSGPHSERPRCAWLDARGSLVAIGERRDATFVVVRGFSTELD
jgi:tRNA pseudouridine55 synthase